MHIHHNCQSYNLCGADYTLYLRSLKNVDLAFIHLHDIPIKLHDRETIFKLQSLTRNQFGAPIFKEFLKMGWANAGYTENRMSDCMTPTKFCFDVLHKDCMTDNCDECAFIRCDHCHFYLCFDHFYTSNHYCHS